MELNGPVTTWLDTIVATRVRKSKVNATIHQLAQTPQRSRDCCYVISVNQRWLCSTNGRVTVLHGRSALERFVSLLGLTHCPQGDTVSSTLDCNSTAHCLSVDRRHCLRTCKLQLDH